MRAAIVGDDAGSQVARDRSARCLIGRLYANLELPATRLLSGTLTTRLRMPMSKTALSSSAREAVIYRFDGASYPSVKVTSSGSLRPRRFMSSKNAVTVWVFITSIPPSDAAVPGGPQIVKPQAGYRFALRAQGRDRSGDAGDKQILVIFVLAQISLGEGLVILPEPFPKLRHRGLGLKKPTVLVL